MISFPADYEWSPPGSRPHIHIPMNDAVRELAMTYADVFAQWRADWQTVLQLVRPRFLHSTLAWLNQVTSTVPRQQLTLLQEAIAEQVDGIEPFEIVVGPAFTATYGVWIDITPDRPIAELTTRMRTAVDKVFNTGLTDPEYWTPHIGMAHCISDVPDGVLTGWLAWAKARGSRYRPERVTLPVSSVILVDQDTFTSEGVEWDTDTVQVIPFT